MHVIAKLKTFLALHLLEKVCEAHRCLLYEKRLNKPRMPWLILYYLIIKSY